MGHRVGCFRMICGPSRLLRNQLLWAGLVTGQELVSAEDTMGAVPIGGNLIPVADQIVERALAMWGTDGVLEATHATSFGRARR